MIQKSTAAATAVAVPFPAAARRATLGAALLATLGLGLVAGCGQGDRDTPPAPVPDGETALWPGAEADTMPDLEAAASHILIQYAGCPGAPPDLARTRKEAQSLAHHVNSLARERGADFAELAREYSEDPRAEQSGGYLGIIRQGQMVLDFEVALFNLEVGQTAIVETEYGWHVIKRWPVRRVRAHHILIAWEGSRNSSGGVTRTQPQAEALAREVHAQAALPGADLCELARKFSDDPNNRTTCGDLGVIEPGRLVPAFDAALFKLRPGQVSPVVETDYGYHIIWRD